MTAEQENRIRDEVNTLLGVFRSDLPNQLKATMDQFGITSEAAKCEAYQFAMNLVKIRGVRRSGPGR